MKKALVFVLSVALMTTLIVSPTFAAVDTTTSATTAPAAPAAPKAPTAPKAGNPAPASTSGTYSVVSGDAFWKIAKQHNLTIQELAKLNPQVKDINKIFVGDKLIVKGSVAAATATKLYFGVGNVPVYRPSKNQLNLTNASVLFDQNGKIVDLTWDVMEITQTLFPGWHDPKADPAKISEFAASINATNWLTKREEGYDYDMTHKKSKGVADNLTKKEWFEQLDFYESFFKGKTVAEVEAWFKKYTDVAGRPYKMAYPEKLTAADKTATANFTAEEKAMLVDVTTSATMSLKDEHSDFITALKEAYAVKKEVK